MKSWSLLAIILITVLSGCKEYYTAAGNEKYLNEAYTSAIRNYERVLQKHPEETETRIRLAQCYGALRNYTKAAENYQRVFNHLNTPQKLEFARILKNIENYEGARELLKRVVKETQEPTLAMYYYYMLIDSVYDNKNEYRIEKLNLPEFTSVFSAVKYEGGMVFCGETNPMLKKANPRNGKTFLDLYYAEKPSGKGYETVRTLSGQLKTKFHDGPITFTNTYDTAYVTRNFQKKRKLVKDKENKNNLKIYRIIFEQGAWKQVDELPFNGDNFSTGHPAVSKDGKLMFFTSDRPGGLGGTDIYAVRVTGNDYSEPVNLGPSINTPGNEMFPYFQDSILYYSSDFLPGLGGLDIFRTSLQGDGWAQPINLGNEINSSADDFSYFETSDTTGFFSSNRDGSDNIYEFIRKSVKTYIPEPMVMLTGIIHDKDTKAPLPNVYINADGVDGTYKFSTTTNDLGEFKLELIKGIKYNFLAKKDTFFTYSLTIDPSENMEANISIEKIVIDKPIKLENIYYDLAKWDITEQSARELDNMVSVLKNNPAIQVELSSHTDSRGNDMYNLELSEKRAHSAVDYIVSKGIDISRISAKGYGETKLLNDCGNGIVCSEEQHYQNRRTEFKVVNMNYEKLQAQK